MHLVLLAMLALNTRTVTVTPWPSPFGCLSCIAATEQLDLSQLEAANPQISDPNVVQVGEVVNLPGAATTTPTTQTAATVAESPSSALPGDFCAGQSRQGVWPGFTGNEWQTPPGCFGGVYSPNPADYYQPAVPWGQCSWWPSALLHIAGPAALPLHPDPRVHSVMWWNPQANNEPYSHFAFVEAISPDGQWVLTSEMNMYFRGGGFGHVIFMYRPVNSATGFFW